MPVIAVSGLAAEARIARAAGFRAVAAGGNAALTTERLQRSITAGTTALISFGISGGLDPTLASGTVLLPAAVVTEKGERSAVDQDWHEALLAALGGAGRSASAGETLGAAAIAASAAAKAALFHATGAIAIDLESHLVARAAHARALPFVVLRVIADPAARELPPAALLPLDANGRPVIPAVLRSLATAPAQLPALLRLALDTRRALAVLRDTTRLLLPRLRQG